MASNEWLVRKLHEQDKKIEALSRGGTGVGHSSIAPGENLTVISDNGEVVLGAGGVEHVDGPTPATPTAPTLKLGFGTIETTWDGSFAEGEDEDGVPLTAPVDFDVVEVHCSTDPEEEEWGDDTMRGQIKAREGGTITVGGFDVDDEVFVCLIALAKTGKRSGPSATASLVIEGLDFSQLFSELDAANATIKNAGEVLVSEQGTLDEKLTEVDGTLNDLGQDLQAVEDAQAQLNTDLTDVMTSVDGKNTITWNPSAPSKVSNPGKAVGDLWYRTSGNNIVGFWKWDGTDWVTQLLDKTTIPLIDIGAGTFGSMAGSRLEAGSVTADRLVVGISQNLVVDPKFKNSTINAARTSNGSPNTWNVVQSGTETWYQNKPGVSLTSKFFYLTTDGVSTNAATRIAVDPDSKWHMSVEVNVDSANTQGITYLAASCVAYNADGTARFLTKDFLRSDNGLRTINPGDGWVRLDCAYDWTEYSGAVTVAPRVYVVTGGNGGSFYSFRNPFVGEKVGTTLIQDGGITTPKLSADVLEVKNLKATTGQLDEAVINKLFSDVVVAKTAVANAFIGENAILTGAVTAPKITASEELWAKIAQFVKIRAEHIEADAIDGMVITGATIRSAATGARTLMSASGFEAYDNAGKRTFFASASTGNVSMTGELYTGDPGSERVVLDNSLWNSVEVEDPDTGTQKNVPGAGVRIGVSSSSGADVYHAATTATDGRYVDQAVVRGPFGRSKTIYGAVSSANGLPSSNYVSSTATDNSGKIAAKMNATVGGDGTATRKVELVGYDANGNSRAVIRVSGGNGRSNMWARDGSGVETSEISVDGPNRAAWIGGRDSSGVVTAQVTTFGNAGLTAVNGSHQNPLIVNYTGDPDSWIVPFRKSGTDWGYVGSTGAMGVNEFGIQSAAGKDLRLQDSNGANIILGTRSGSPRIMSDTIYNTTGVTSAAVYVNSTTGSLGRNTSSARYKQEIKPAGPLDEILNVETRYWRDRQAVAQYEEARAYMEQIGEGPLPRQLSETPVEPGYEFGAIAEEVDALGLKELVIYDAFERPDSLHYEKFGVALISPVKRHDEEIKALRDRITELERLTNE